MLNRRALLILIAVALAGQALALLPLSAVARTLGLLLFAAGVPGLLLANLLIGRSAQRPGALEFGLYGVAAGYALLTLGLLYLSYLPGALNSLHVLLAANLGLALLAALAWRKADNAPVTAGPPLYVPLSAGWFALAVGSLLLVGAGLRLTHLGYTEFQGDEARAMLRSAAVIQGFDEALMLHKKGPLEILLPTAGYAVSERTTEAAARLPFAAANLAGLLALFVLGWAMFGPVAGWSAAMLLAVEGYLIGFARIVQYQSVVVLMTVLTVLILYRLYRAGRLEAGYLTLAALFTTAGLLAHYETAAVAIPGAFLLWHTLRKGADWRPLIGPTLLGAALLASFYLPFVLHPNFGNTYAYLADDRIGGQLPYNHLNDFFLRTTLYNSSYHFILLTALLVLALLMLYGRNLGGPWRWVVAGLVVAGLALVIAQPSLFVVGERDWTLLLFALALAPTPFLPRQSTAERTLWLWFGALFLIALFLIAKPRTHVYVFFMPWALLAGMVIGRGWRWLARATRPRTAMAAGITVATLVTLLLAAYPAQLFAAAPREVYRTWAENKPAGYWTPYAEPINSSLFGLPTRNGWKALGAGYADGSLRGPYETNDFDEWVTYWYSRGAERCWRDHTYLAVGDHSERKRQAETAELLAATAADHTRMTTVTVGGQPRLDIYAKDAPADLQPATVAIERVGSIFDTQLSGPDLPLDAPTVDPQFDEALDLVLGDRIELAGYRLASRTVVPGDMIDLTLYWRARGEIDEAYTVFNQLIGPENAMFGQLDAQPGCGVRPTDDWPMGEYVVDRYRIPVFQDATPGVYPLIAGMYDDERDRLPVFAADGASLGEAISLGEVTVVPSSD